MKLTKEKRDEMFEAALPLIEWMTDNCHPHHTALVDLRGIVMTGEIACMNRLWADDSPAAPLFAAETTGRLSRDPDGRACFSNAVADVNTIGELIECCDRKVQEVVGKRIKITIKELRGSDGK